jgi:integrase
MLAHAWRAVQRSRRNGTSFCTLCAVLAPRIISANAALSPGRTERNGQWPTGTKAARRHAGPQTVGSPARGHARVKGIRDRTSWLTLLYHGTRREELCGLRIKDLHSRQGVMHFRFKGKRAKIRFVPALATSGSPPRFSSFFAQTIIDVITLYSEPYATTV